MAIRLDQLKKLEAASLRLDPVRHDSEEVELIVRVREPNYVPPALTVRARIDSCLFTCRVAAKVLVDLEHDPHVVSVSISKKLSQ